MKIVLKRANRPPAVKYIDNSLAALQELVGGSIEVITISRDLVCIINGDGKLLGLPANIRFGTDIIVGHAVFCGVNGDDFADIPPMWEQHLMKVLEGASV